MENASKALIMAGSVLIALMIIGALILMFNSLSSYQDTNTQTAREAQIIEFNNQYETFNRNDVRGSDLYSLLNRVVDYNRRKSTSGIGSNDEGADIAFEPMTISYDLKKKEKDLTWDKTNRLFDDNYRNFELDGVTVNQFEIDIKRKIEEAKKIAINENSMQNLASGIDKLFLKENPRDDDLWTAIKLWKANAKNTYEIENAKSYYESIINSRDNKEKIYTYYEYMQFKRAKFNCENTEYNPKTGRIIKMEFKFNGKIE